MSRKPVGEVLGELSGLGKQEVHRIWEQVKANHARLDARTLSACAAGLRAALSSNPKEIK